MDKQDDKIVTTPTEARAGSTPHVVRYVLLVSLALAVIAMAFVFLGGSFGSRNAQKEGVAAERAKQIELQQQGINSDVEAKPAAGQN